MADSERLPSFGGGMKFDGRGRHGISAPVANRHLQSSSEVQATLHGAFDSNEDDSDEEPSTVGEAVSGLTDGYPYRYDCVRGMNESLTQLVIEFDYEYVATNPAMETSFDVDSLPIALPAMEWGLLWTLAYDLGLHGCQILNDSPHSRRRLLEDGSVDYRIVTLSSRPLDRIDPTTSKLWSWLLEWEVLIYSRYTLSLLYASDSCQFLTAETSHSICYPMRGAVMAQYAAGSGRNMSVAVIEEIRRLSRETLDHQMSLTGKVVATLYLGSRAEYALANAPAHDLRKSKANYGSFTTIMASIVASAIVLAVAIYLFVRGRTNKEQTKDRKSEDRKDASPADVEAGFSEEFPAVVGTDSAAARSIVNIAVKSIGSSTTILMSTEHREDRDGGLPDLLSVISTASTDESAGSEGAVRVRPLTPSPSDCSQTAEMIEHKQFLTMSEETILPLASSELPPLPPSVISSKLSAAAVAATSSTRRRRKKKKRKKTRLTRVSSRENVQGMETINETEERDGDDDDGSEYSWSTSDTDGSRSRDPSPARPESPLNFPTTRIADSSSTQTTVADRPYATSSDLHSRPPRFPSSSPSAFRENASRGHEC
jgi:membrane protein implicated in regulation of membrane protease activity